MAVDVTLKEQRRLVLMV
ncbi:hypothetical protein [Candidatus Vallotia tarda]